MTIPTLFQAMDETFMPDSMVYLMAAPREEDGYISVRFGGTQDDLRYMFQEIGTCLYQARIITEEQWRTVCIEDPEPHH